VQVPTVTSSRFSFPIAPPVHSAHRRAALRPGEHLAEPTYLRSYYTSSTPYYNCSSVRPQGVFHRSMQGDEMKAKSGNPLWIGVVLAVALVAAACGGDSGTEGPSDPGQGAGPTGGEFSMSTCEPQFLQPGNTQESCGGQVLQSLFSPLVEFDPETSEPSNLVAESIESDDLQNWTVKIKEGWTFHDGTPVTAQSFVDAWNWAAFAPNRALNNYFFGNIEGYADLNPDEGKPSKEAMSGLEVVDDTTFTVTLTEPFGGFPLTVGYTAFFPLPESFFDDPDAFNEAPVGNGPYMMDGEWNHDQGINVVKYPDYAGDEGNADAIEFRIYADVNTAYTDLIAGELDIIDTVPTEVLAQAPQDLGEGFIQAESSYFGYLGFPIYQEPWDQLELRQAVSMAIDREAITTAIFQGAYTPANSIISPVVPGFREEACGDVCRLDAAAAKELWDANGGPSEIVLWFNNDGGHEEWMEALANQLRENLGVETKFESLAFEEFLTLQNEKKLTGPFRLAWAFDYPHPQNYLEPIFSSSGSSQELGYEELDGAAAVDDLIAQANATEDLDAAVELYQQAEDQVLADLPATPLWFGVTQAGYNTQTVDNVIFDVFSFARVADVEVLSQ
jgi:oligopeptide transport system substrate-binding protein